MENLPPHIIRLVYKEVTTLTADPPDGIKVFPNEEDLTDLQVTIEGPGECGIERRRSVLVAFSPSVQDKQLMVSSIRGIRNANEHQKAELVQEQEAPVKSWALPGAGDCTETPLGAHGL